MMSCQRRVVDVGGRGGSEEPSWKHQGTSIFEQFLVVWRRGRPEAGSWRSSGNWQSLAAAVLRPSSLVCHALTRDRFLDRPVFTPDTGWCGAVERGVACYMRGSSSRSWPWLAPDQCYAQGCHPCRWSVRRIHVPPGPERWIWSDCCPWPDL